MIIKSNQNETKLAKSIIFPTHFGGYVRNYQNEQGIWYFWTGKTWVTTPEIENYEMDQRLSRKIVQNLQISAV